MEWSWPVLREFLPELWRGAFMTVAFTLAAFPLALAIGLGLALAEGSPRPWLRSFTRFLVDFIRGTPLLVQIYVLYFTIPQAGLRLPAPLVGVLALAIHYGCYVSRVYAAGLRSVPRGQWEAAAALGLSRGVAFRKVAFRQAIVPIYPALSNYLVTLFKETPLLSAIGIVELMGAAKIAGAETFRYTEPFTAVAVVFLALSLLAVALLRWGERWVGAYRAK